VNMDVGLEVVCVCVCVSECECEREREREQCLEGASGIAWGHER